MSNSRSSRVAKSRKPARMFPDIRWITPLYGFDPDSESISVPETARERLKQMAHELVGTSRLVAIYVPLGTDEIYEAGDMRGRVVGAVRLLKMPRNRRMEDYYSRDWDESLRWPIGWPCQAIYAPEEHECPTLRDHVDHLFGQGTFSSYVKRFLLGPFELEPAIRERLNRDFSQFSPVDG
jgi:hypothetical protein